MKKIFFLFLALLLSSCAPRLTTTISSPSGPKVVFVQPAKPFVLGELTEKEVERAAFGRCVSANRGNIRFYSEGCFRAWIWLEEKGDREPDFSLIPGQIMDVIAPVGVLKIYAEAERQDLYGWHDLGAITREIRVSPYVWRGGEGWRVDFYPGEFPGMR